MTTKDCDTCAFAHWKRTAAGRLHPSGDGRCTWQHPVILLPKSMYFHNSPKPSGGYINRKDLQRTADCPAWEVIF